MAEEGTGKRNVKILKCTCQHDYQDKRYGKGKRVHNRKADGTWTCTVCRSEKGVGGI